MLTKLRGISLWMAACALLTGCAEFSAVHHNKQLGDTEVLLTSAELRQTYARRGTYDSKVGRFEPRSVVCAEPSPDVVKAVQASFGASVGIAKQGAGSGSGALSASHAEAAAQLGERLATIQLLRDGLYRACEAFANGSISEVTYAVLLSGYDDTMVTMLLGELAAGAFGRSLAALGGEAESKAAAKADIDEKRKQRQESERELATSRSEKSEIEQSLKDKRVEEKELESMLKTAKKQEGEAQAARDAVSDDSQDAQRLDEQLEESKKEVAKLETEREENKKEISSLETELTEKQHDVTEAEEEFALKSSAETEAASKATATAAGSITPGQQKAEIAATLQLMQRKFIENINTDALMVACVTAMSRPLDGPPTPLAALCAGDANRPGLVEQIVQGESLKLLEAKRYADIQSYASGLARLLASMEQAVKAVDEYKKTPTKPAQ